MPVLEQIRILSNLETDRDKLLQIVLVGQLNLNPLKAPQMRQLDQRVLIRCQLRPPEPRRRCGVHVASSDGRRRICVVTFQPNALDMVHTRTRGIPRLINLVCDRSLLAAYSERTNRVSADMVYQAAERLEFVEERPSRFNRFRRHAAVAALAAGASVSLGVAASSVAPVLRASTTARVREAGSTLGDEGAWRRVLAGECATELDAKAQAGRMSQTLASADAQVIRY